MLFAKKWFFVIQTIPRRFFFVAWKKFHCHVSIKQFKNALMSVNVFVYLCYFFILSISLWNKLQLITKSQGCSQENLSSWVARGVHKLHHAWNQLFRTFPLPNYSKNEKKKMVWTTNSVTYERPQSQLRICKIQNWTQIDDKIHTNV
jgi:hypothetical protein